jgi:ferric-dicitrate binding protein FerR (iron transport regulator)
MSPVAFLPRLAAGAGMALAVALAPAPSVAAPSSPRVEEVPSRPAFVRAPGSSERAALPGQNLVNRTLLRTQTPGRMQVRLGDGRHFRLGGDALLRLSGDGLDLLRGRIIAWLTPAGRAAGPLRLRTRVATASIEGTTVFVDATADSVKIFSWEGTVHVTTSEGRHVDLSSGEELEWSDGRWRTQRRLSPEEAATRRRTSPLLNGYTAPMDTLPQIEKELGIGPTR